ncbi:hypothetical protein D3C80_1545310 [compost metagenome]
MRVGHVGANALQSIGIGTPAQVESSQLGKPELAGVGQMVMNPPGQWRPVAMLFVPRQQCRDHDAGSSAEAPTRIRVIPDVRGKVFFIGCAAVLVVVLGTLGIHCGRAVGRTNGDPSEAVLQRLKQLFAKLPTRFDRTLGVVRDIRNAFDLADFRVEEIAHEEALRQPDPAQFFQRIDGGWLVHLMAS